MTSAEYMKKHNETVNMFENHRTEQGQLSMISELGKAQIFTVLNAKGSLLQAKLDDNSYKLTTFCTQLWLKMPFSAPKKSQRGGISSNELAGVEGLAGVTAIVDDPLVMEPGVPIKKLLKTMTEILIAMPEEMQGEKLQCQQGKAAKAKVLWH